MKTLILGGIRSGKSRFAENLAARSGLPVTYIATATAGDEEMRDRIAAHRARRDAGWTVIEEPRDLTARLREQAAAGRCVIVDCLTLWLTNLLLAADKARYSDERDALLDTLPRLTGEIILVSNETSMGIVPTGELTRRFGDEAGRLHQALAQCCERVAFMVAGLPMALKGAPL